jgi:endonuclease YncB( thermonuclease family)
VSEGVYGPYRGIVRDWHDGDTCHLDLDLGFGFALLAYNPITGKPIISCRSFGINAPELKSGTAGHEALVFANEIAPAGTLVTVTSHGWDKYGGRFDGQLLLPNGDDFSARMVEAGQAKVAKY